MTANHTPGPWTFASEEGFCSQIDGADGSVVCCFDEDPNEADAKLMGKAPELLNALINLCNATDGIRVASEVDRDHLTLAVMHARACVAETRR